MPHGSRTLPTKAALWIFVVGCLLSAGRMIVDTPGINHDQVDTALRRGQRFAELRRVLPRRGVIGYIGQRGDTVGHYYLAQYALAPLVVDHSLDHSIVVGNFPGSRPAGLPKNLELVRDFGDGVLLFANKDAQ
jgi:hypothetical protein